MNQLGRAVLKLADWDGFAAACAARIPADSPLVHADHIKREVGAGRMKIFHAVHDGQRTGIVTYDIEQLGNGRELVIIAAYSASGRETTLDFMDAIKDAARALGCQQIRLHTARAGVVKRAVQSGMRVSEIILRKTVSA